jgi:ABC-type glycerol-3-phosphate transport system permease component
VQGVVESKVEDRTIVYETHRRVPWGTWVRHAVVSLCVISILFPILWVVLLSVKSMPDAYNNYIWPKQFDFSHYSYALRKNDTLPQNLLNSVIVTVGTVVVTTVCAVFAGYALVHLRMPGRRIVLALFVASMFFPTRVTALIAIWQIQNSLGLLNVTWGLILPYVTLGLALSVFLMRGIFEAIPRELADSARLDGAGSFTMLWGVMLPLVRNGVVVVIIVNFVAAWGEYLLASTLMADQDTRTLPVVLASAAGGMGAWAWPRIAAVYVMTILPALLVFGISQRWYMKGLQEGAMKV